MTKTTVDLNQIETVSRAALVAHGASGVAADAVAAAIRKAEATGNVICGLYYLESYCVQLRSGRVKGDAVPAVSRPRPGAVLADARLGFAHPAFAAGLDTAMTAVREAGTASFAVQHAHTCTSLGYFTEQIAGRGAIAIGFTNASAIVSPPGGNRAVLGTNPISMAVPGRTPGSIAFQFDYSTSAVALGKITMAKAAGEQIPLGWAVDAEGRPTTDPEAALKGSLVSAGGYKGYGFSLMAEVLAACLTGSVPSLDVRGLKLAEGPPHDLGQTYLLIDPALHAGQGFWDTLDRIGDAITAQEGARLPGSARTLPDLVEIDADLWALAQRLAATE